MQIVARNRWKRAGISFASAIASELLVGVGAASIDGPSLFIEHVFGFVYFASFLVIPGWLIALPIILRKRFDRLTAWQQVAIGTLMGPSIMVAIGIYGGIESGTGFAYKVEAFRLLYIAIGVSFLTSAIYVTALRFCFSKDFVQNPS